MTTTKTQGKFTTGIISSLLFFSMQNPAEIYLSGEIKSNSKTAEIKDLKGTLDKKISGLFRRDRSLDNEIETAMNNMNNPEQESIIDKLFAEEVPQDAEVRNAKYATEANAFAEIKSSFKSLYSTFVGYAKATYGSIVSRSRKIDGFVKLTLQKILKVAEYVMCLCSPHWNKVEGSPEDMDSRAYAVSQKESISSDNAKYENGYGFIRYQTG
ncbi:MAG: hypothetical protein IIC69_02885 [Nanoarchaeota archaeon]|nr:hypothetical protein [Nanoarchaeota archaeon]